MIFLQLKETVAKIQTLKHTIKATTIKQYYKHSNEAEVPSV
jgi:hypothetical protein